MHKQLTRPPITYVLAQIRFSSIEAMGKYIPDLQEDIRKTFPIFNKIEIQTIQIVPNTNAVPTDSTITQWHFIDKASTTGILLDQSSLIIHTSQYKNFSELMTQFESVLETFNKRLNFNLSLRLGVRYINLIDSKLTDYINPGLLGFHLKNKKLFHIDKFLIKTEAIQRSALGNIKTQSIYVGDKEIAKNIQNCFVPADLFQTANNLSFKHHEKPKDNFIILDIDHFSENRHDFKTSQIINDFHKLQDGSYEAFHAAVTSKALKDWT